MPNSTYKLRAALGNLEIPDLVDEIIFQDFIIKSCPNHVVPIQFRTEYGDDVDWQYPDDPDPRYPVCDYYLDANITALSGHGWAAAETFLPWILTKLRLYKPGHLWGSLFEVIDNTHPGTTTGIDDVNASLQRRHSLPPSRGLTIRPNSFKITEPEIESITHFVNAFGNVPPANFGVAIRRFNLFFDRDVIEDRAVDLFIALESLLSEGPEAIGYKIALRASYLIGSDRQEKLMVNSFLKRAYSQRSNIVHGTDGAIQWLNDNDSDGGSNVDKLEEIVRKVLINLLNYSMRGIDLNSRNIDDTLFFNSSL